MRKSAGLLALLIALHGAGLSAAAAGPPVSTDAATATAQAEAPDTGYLPYSEPRAVEPVNLWSALARTVISLGIVLGLLGGTLLVLRRWMPGLVGPAGANPVRLIGRIGLAPRQTVYLLHVSGRVLLVGSGGGQLSTLGEITDPAEVAALLGAAPQAFPPRGQAFAGVLARGLRPAAVRPTAGPAPREDAALDAIRRQIANLRAMTGTGPS